MTKKLEDNDLEKITGGATQEKSPIETYTANGVTNRATNLFYYNGKNYIYGDDVQAGMEVTINGKSVIWGSNYYCIMVNGKENFIAAYCVDIKN